MVSSVREVMNIFHFVSQSVIPIVLSIQDSPGIWDKLESYLTVLAPLLLIAILGIGIYYIYAAGTSKTITGTALGECKRDIIRAMRQKISGLTVSEVAAAADITKEQAIEILQEMKSDNQVYSTRFRGKEVWCVKGIGEGNLYTS